MPVVFSDNSSAKVRGDEAYQLAKSAFQSSELFNALNAATLAIVFRRQFYGKNSAEVREALDLAKHIQSEIIVQNPSMAPRKRRSKSKPETL